MVILTWKCLLSGLMLCDSHIMESPWASSPKMYKPMSSFVGPRSTPALCTGLKFQSSRQGFGCKAGICCWSDANCLSWETLRFGWQPVSSLKGTWNVYHVDREQRTSTQVHTRGATFQKINLMKHIFNAFPRSALELEGKLFLNVFDPWCLGCLRDKALWSGCVWELAEATIH